MPNLNVIFSMGSLPEGFQGTPQEFADLIAERLQAAISGDFLTGQVGGAIPTRDAGVFFDNGPTKRVLLWDEDEASYQPLAPSLPVGSMAMWPSASAPLDTDWIILSGQLVLISEYPSLHAVLGDTYKLPSDGSLGLYFRLPKPQGRSPIGEGQGEFADTAGSGRTDKTNDASLGKYVGYDFVSFDTAVATADKQVPQRSQTQPSYTYTNFFTNTTPPGFVVNFIIKAK